MLDSSPFKIQMVVFPPDSSASSSLYGLFPVSYQKIIYVINGKKKKTAIKIAIKMLTMKKSPQVVESLSG